MTNEKLNDIVKSIEELNNIIPLKLETLMDIKLCISKAISDNNKPLTQNEIIDLFCMESSLSDYVKNEILKISKQSYIKGSNDCYDIWVKNK